LTSSKEAFKAKVVEISSMIGISSNADKVMKIRKIERDLNLKRRLVLVMVLLLYLSGLFNQAV